MQGGSFEAHTQNKTNQRMYIDKNFLYLSTEPLACMLLKILWFDGTVFQSSIWPFTDVIRRTCEHFLKMCPR